MNNFSQSDIYNMTYTIISYMDNVFSLWITITFAAILAVYFTSEKLTRFLRHLIIFLYFSTAIMLIIRWMIGASNIGAITTIANELNLQTTGTTPYLNEVGGFLNIFIFIVGTIATTYFLFTHGKNQKSS